MTLAEAIVSIMLVGVMLTAALSAVGSSRAGQKRTLDWRFGQMLADDLLSEIMEQNYQDATDTPAASGPSPAESAAGNRSLFNDVNDYANWTESPPRRKDGTTVPQSNGWTRKVRIEFLDPANRTAVTATNLGVTRITVTVLNSNVIASELTAIRTSGLPPLEACCLSGAQCDDLPANDCIDFKTGKPQGAGTQCVSTQCSAMVAHWTMDEGGGNTAADSVADRDAALSGHGWGVGHISGAVTFSGSGRGEVTHNNGLTLTKKLTLTAWIYKSNTTGYQMVLTKGTALLQENYWLGTDGDEVSFGFYNLAFQDFITTGVNLRRNQWYHIAGSYNGDTGEVRIHVNGVLVHTATTLSTPLANTQNIYLGRSQYGEYWRGRLDDIRIYDYVLSDGEIQALAD